MPPKTRKRRTRTHQESEECADQATTYGLYKWYKSTFTRFGWMLLERNKPDTVEKINSYKKGMTILENKLECKIKTIKDKDKRDDLQIMLNNLRVLKEHAMQDL